MDFQNKKFDTKQDFGQKWRRFLKTGLRAQEYQASRASLSTVPLYRLRY
jgi:hypothetical protein